MSFVSFLKKYKKYLQPVIFVRKIFRDIKTYARSVRNLKASNIDVAGKNIFYFGKPVHSNLGDLAQGMCIVSWMKEHYPDYNIVKIETESVVHTHFPIISKLKKQIKDDDLFVFQSGYTTTDLGGYSDLMHRTICQAFPNNIKIMMPQTVYFRDEKNRELTSRILNADPNLLFLSRDRVSYEAARSMFPDIEVKLFPDIVTTLIGKKEFSNPREGVLFCLRNDTEKYYSDSELDQLMNRCRTITDKIERLDTTKAKSKDLLENTQKYIDEEIEHYARYRVIVTDRYHGTILSLAASTPVVILKTTDHKVVTGADWFKGVLDGFVYVANDPEDACALIEKLYYNEQSIQIGDYFKRTYYDKLPGYVEALRKKNHE